MPDMPNLSELLYSLWLILQIAIAIRDLFNQRPSA